MNVTLRRRIAAAAVALAVPVLSSCGFDYQTDQVYTPGRGVNDRSGSVDVLHALIVSGTDGSGTVVATLVNNDTENDDALTGIAGAGDDASLTVENAGAAVEIPASGLEQLGETGDISASGTGIEPGNFIELTFTFERGKSVTVEVPVVSSGDDDFADVPVPSGS